MSALLLSLIALAVAPRVVPAPVEFRSWPMVYMKGDLIYVAKADGRQAKALGKGDSPCWSPDRRQVAFERDGAIWTQSLSGGKPTRIWALRKNSGVYGLSWGIRVAAIGRDAPPAGSSLVWSSGLDDGSSIMQAMLGKRAEVEELGWLRDGTGFSFSDYRYPAWDRTGKRLAFSVNGDLWAAFWNGESGWDVIRLAATAMYDAPTYRADRSNIVIHSIAWSPDGSALAYGLTRQGGTGDAVIRIVRLRQEPYDAPRVIPGSDRVLLEDAHTASFSPDGRWVMATSGDPVLGGDGIVAVSTDGKRQVRVLPHGRVGKW